jgi:hypothetical protein
LPLSPGRKGRPPARRCCFPLVSSATFAVTPPQRPFQPCPDTRADAATGGGESFGGPRPRTVGAFARHDPGLSLVADQQRMALVAPHLDDRFGRTIAHCQLPRFVARPGWQVRASAKTVAQNGHRAQRRHHARPRDMPLEAARKPLRASDISGSVIAARHGYAA